MPEHLFQCHVTRDMRKRGIVGAEAWVRVGDEALEVTGADAGQFRIRVDDIARIRIGYVDTKTRTYETRLWTFDAPRPLQLAPTRGSWASYRDGIRQVTGALVAKQRRDRVETGYSKFDAMFGPVLTGLLAIASLGISIFVLENEPWWGRMIVPAVPLLVFGILLWVGVKRSWPRPIQELSELEVQLPPTHGA